MPEITRIEKTFTYDMPDAYLHQTSALNKTGTWTYKGPRYMWIFADAETKKVISRFHYTEADNGADVPQPNGQIKILVDANVNPDIASLLHNEWDYGVDLPQYTEELPDGSFYGHSDPQAPDHTYELTEIQYDVETSSFIKPYAWKQPHVTWAELLVWRNTALENTDSKMRTCPAEKLEAWQAYRQKLRDIPAVFEGVDPWKVPFPQDPDAVPLTPGE